MTRRFALVFVAILAIAVSFPVSACAQTYDVYDDFWGPIRPAGNPWSYGHGSTWGSTMTPMSNFTTTATGPTWNTGSSDPNVIKVVNTFPYGVPGDVHLHPGVGKHAIVRWQAPHAGTVTLNGKFLSRNSGDKEVRLSRHGGSAGQVSIQSAVLVNTGQQMDFSGTTLTVDEGEFLDLSVGPSGDGISSDSTALFAVINLDSATVPEPTSAVLLLACALPLGLCLRTGGKAKSIS